ncbi:hypothetical protein SAMN06272755_0123 [Picosynechococcus sp. OG1]|uniref:hypothetical protein n=2 Tax=Cyanobacteriota TaxID=1117 RepID=UPI00016DC9C1|nr:conserved hypothetical membrane protein [Picosynechococcus sp. PCC 7002]AMA09272.1 hypothetical protein AWQ23_08055 [Picosynechococcus sp. PCC 73109]ANV87416.1 hypothetical protein AWQ22_08085 [Picosynechococcus sp. PCC 7117]ANV90566.1 hypothetical protein AWQ24_07965 [Picosynechococcus sp. PCC 8807]SMH29665.1 hypothetical protein SAMN06272755_0123 [Picosynechococcus sp. OG1]SMQ83756.1 hypothetical protein SAMN06272774_2500 [Synechococcus sp. 7002]
MKATPRFFPSLCITVTMSFLAPMVVCGLLLTLCAAVGIFPGVTVELLTDAFGNVLKVFGNGRIWEGVLVIAIACGFVGGMFETFNFYYYQNMN